MAKKQQRIVVGKWENGNFIALDKQPEGDPYTEMASVIMWCKVNLGPGEYSFVRQVPGALLIAEQTQMKFTYVEG